mmetsp:Transcript_33341/g.131389  ORF Transcript_33341/g.131389 Transcript_33341/m.131389 type:complete len:133 (-) Transcript_33341:3556-3954(-)
MRMEVVDSNLLVYLSGLRFRSCSSRSVRSLPLGVSFVRCWVEQAWLLMWRNTLQVKSVSKRRTDFLDFFNQSFGEEGGQSFPSVVVQGRGSVSIFFGIYEVYWMFFGVDGSRSALLRSMMHSRSCEGERCES